MVGIDFIHWGDLGVRNRHGEPGRLLALWPAPLDHDACFEQAGFDSFADTDAAWDADFAILIEDMLAILGTYGSPVVTGEPIARRPFIGRLVRKRAAKFPLSEQLSLVAHDDQFAPCHMEFGTPVQAAVHVSDGHPILWLWLNQGVASGWPGHLNSVARGRKLIETALRWSFLLPASLVSALVK